MCVFPLEFTQDIPINMHKPLIPNIETDMLSQKWISMQCILVYNSLFTFPNSGLTASHLLWLPIVTIINNNYCYIARVNTKRDWLTCGHVALDKCNVSRWVNNFSLVRLRT
jgi:hypothetical protein